MGTAENKELVRNMFAELSKGNAEGFLGKFADDVSFTLMGSTRYSGTCNGKQEAIAKVLGPLTSQLEGLTITPDNLIAEGDYVVVQSRSDGRVKSGGTYNNHYCQIFRIADGKVREFTEYLDTDLVNRTFK
jgi:ketosteroid isomerase-like protein